MAEKPKTNTRADLGIRRLLEEPRKGNMTSSVGYFRPVQVTVRVTFFFHFKTIASVSVCSSVVTSCVPISVPCLLLPISCCWRFTCSFSVFCVSVSVRATAPRCCFVFHFVASVSCDRAVGVAEGPHEQIMQTKFKEKKSIEEDDDDSVLLDFVEHLLPQKESFRTQMVPAGIYRSRVPDIHDDFRVLLAIVECQGHETFKSYACQSILKFWWTKENMPVRTLFLRACLVRKRLSANRSTHLF